MIQNQKVSPELQNVAARIMNESSNTARPQMKTSENFREVEMWKKIEVETECDVENYKWKLQYPPQMKISQKITRGIVEKWKKKLHRLVTSITIFCCVPS